MRAIKLILFGTIAALGVLRGAESLIAEHAMRQAILPLALGILFCSSFCASIRETQAFGAAIRMAL
jgi:hypothetical protein